MRFLDMAGSAAVTLMAVTIPSQQGFALPLAKPPIEIHETNEPIRIDGDLDDTGWQGAARVEQFYEVWPGNNREPKVRTVVLLTYDKHNLYIGLCCDDPDPRQIRAPFVDRDGISETDDFVAVYLDTQGDRRAASVFYVNPRGQQTDGIFDDGSGTFDSSPDFYYETKTKITPAGWQAEMRIPFSSLRYDQRTSAMWGVLILRNYPRKEHQQFCDYKFRNVPRDPNSPCTVCNAAGIQGLQNLPNPGGPILTPYVTLTEEGGPRNGVGTPWRNKPVGADAGLDAKWMPTASGAFDGTINPDFSQVESDVGKITFNKQFAVTYPEKRPFFLEATDLFKTPIQAVSTRTITSPRWGARWTDKLDASAYTLLVTEDRGGGSVVIPGPTGSDAASQDFSSFVAIGRWRGDVGKRWSAGWLVTDRENSPSDGGGHNLVFGPDFLWRSPSHKNQVTGQLLYSDTRTPRRTDLFESWDGGKLFSHAADLLWQYTPDNWNIWVEYQDIGDAFRADDGFVPQVGYRSEGAALLYTHTKGIGTSHGEAIVHRLWLGPFCKNKALPEGSTVQRQCGVYLAPTGLWVNLQGGVEVVAREKDLVQTTVVESRFTVYFDDLSADLGRVVSRISLKGWVGDNPDFYNARPGHGADLTPNVTIQTSNHLSLDVNEESSWLDVSAEGPSKRLFMAQIWRLKATYNFDSTKFVRLVGQYSTTTRDPALFTQQVFARDHQFTGSALLAYQPEPGTALYIGYENDSYCHILDTNGVLVPNARKFFLKASYAFGR